MTPRPPRPAEAGADDPLAELPAHRRETFALRVERRLPDLRAALAGLYDDVEVVEAALLRVAAAGFADRSEDLHRLDERRLLRPDWICEPDRFGYACYTERFAGGAGGLAGLRQRIDHLQALGVTYLHLMPLLEPRPGDNDGGYAVADYRAVRPDLGTMDDLEDLATTLREAGISLVVDLVLNHVAREHAWAEKARAGDQRYRDYFLTFPDRTEPDRYEASLPEVFPDFAPGSFSWDDDLGAWVWTTFNTWQWDLNWANPDVLVEFAELVCLLANSGAEVLRLDAIAFLWKRMGTACQNQPEVHRVTQALRAVARIACPAVLFKAEAIVGPRDLPPYLGVGEHTGRVSDLAYHNSLMVQVWSMLATRSTRLARQALAGLPPLPPGAAWITYVRCHDDIGWAIDDGDAAATGVDGHGHRAFLSDWYSGEHRGSWADGLVFQHNPATGDRRISGTTASLVGLDHDLDAGLARDFLAHAVVAGWGGVPVVWSGDELGLPNDEHWAEETGHEDDNRWAHRPRVTDVDLDALADPGSRASRVFAGLAHLARVRAAMPSMHAGAVVEVLDADGAGGPEGVDDGVLAVLRRHAAGTSLCLYNVTPEPRPVGRHLLERHLGTDGDPHDALSGHRLTSGADGVVWLPPYAAWWVVPAAAVPPAS